MTCVVLEEHVVADVLQLRRVELRDGDLVAGLADGRHGLDVVPVAVRLEHPPHAERLAQLEQPLVLVGGVDEDGVTGAPAAHDEHVVLVRTDDDLVDRDVGVDPVQRRGAHRPSVPPRRSRRDLHPVSKPRPPAGRAQSSHAPQPPVRRRARRRRRRSPSPAPRPRSPRPAVAAGLAARPAPPTTPRYPTDVAAGADRSVGAGRESLVVRRDARVRARAADRNGRNDEPATAAAPPPPRHGPRPGRRRPRSSARVADVAPGGADRARSPRTTVPFQLANADRALGRPAERPRRRRDRRRTARHDRGRRHAATSTSTSSRTPSPARSSRSTSTPAPSAPGSTPSWPSATRPAASSPSTTTRPRSTASSRSRSRPTATTSSASPPSGRCPTDPFDSGSGPGARTEGAYDAHDVVRLRRRRRRVPRRPPAPATCSAPASSTAPACWRCSIRPARW